MSIYMMTSNSILEVIVRDNVPSIEIVAPRVDTHFHLFTEDMLTTPKGSIGIDEVKQSYENQKQFLQDAGRAAVNAFNQNLVVDLRFNASIELDTQLGEEQPFSTDSNSVGLAYSMALALKWGEKKQLFREEVVYPSVFATGSVPSDGFLKSVGALLQKVENVCSLVSQNKDRFPLSFCSEKHPAFYILMPQSNFESLDDTSYQDRGRWKALVAKVRELGGVIKGIEHVADGLSLIKGDAFDAGIKQGHSSEFPGLSSISYNQRHLFMGRDGLVEELYKHADEALESRRVLKVCGASGSGKSSAVLAGLIPRLLKQGVSGKRISKHWAQLRPSQFDCWSSLLEFLFRPIIAEIDLSEIEQESTLNQWLDLYTSPEVLATSIRDFHTDNNLTPPIWVIDQCEEVFTTPNLKGEATHFFTFLSEWVHISNSLTIIIIRTEYENETGGHAYSFAHLNPCLSDKELSQILTMQFRYHRLETQGAVEDDTRNEEPGRKLSLLDRIKEDAVGKPLTSISYLLDQIHREMLSESRSSTQLKHSHYEAVGCIEGVMAKQADLALEPNMTNEGTMHEFFTAFVGVDDDKKPVAKAVPMHLVSEYYSSAVHGLIESFKDKGLIIDCGSGDIPKIKLAHDTLLTLDSERPHWQALVQWFSNNREYLTWLKSIEAAFKRWQDESEKNDFLLNKVDVEKSQTFVSQHSNASHLLGYIQQSQQHQLQLLEEEQLTQKRRARITRRVSVIMLMLVVAASWFGWQSSVAQQQAEIQRNTALETQSNFLMDLARQENEKGHHDTALLLGLNAMPGLYGGDRNIPSSVEPLHIATQYSQKKAVFQHKDSVDSASFSPNGKWVITASRDHTASIWDLNTGQRLHTLNHEDEVMYATFSPDSRWAVTTSYDRTSSLWEVATGKRLKIFKQVSISSSPVFSPNGKILVTIGNGASLWDISSGKLVRLLDEKRNVRHAEFSRDGEILLTSYPTNPHAVIWDVTTGQRLQTLNHSTDLFSHAALSPDGKVLITTGLNSPPNIWDVETGSLLNNSKEIIINVPNFSPDGKFLVGSSDDYSDLYLWNVTTDSKLKLANNTKAHDVKFSPDGRKILIVSDSTVTLWNIYKTGYRKDFPLQIMQHETTIGHATFSSDGQKILTASENGTATVWAVEPWFAHEEYINHVALSPDGKKLITASTDNTAAIWDSETGKRLQVLKHPANVKYAAFSPDGNTVVTTSEDNTSVILWDVITGLKLKNFEHEVPVYRAEFSPDGKKLLTSTLRNNTFLWNVATGKSLATLHHDRRILYASFSPSGHQVITASSDQTAMIWSAKTGRIQYVLKHNDYVHNAFFSPDGKKVVTTSGDKTAVIWDSETGKRLQVLKHPNYVNYAVFSPDGKQLLTTTLKYDSYPEMILLRKKKELPRPFSAPAVLWNVDNGQLLRLFEQEGGVQHTDFSPDGLRVVTTQDKEAVIWDAITGKKIQLLKYRSDIHQIAFNPDGKKIAINFRDGFATLSDVSPVTIENIIELLPKNRTCLTPSERKHFFLPSLTNKQLSERGCSQYIQ